VDDENFVSVQENIESILDENLKNVQGVIEIYDKYAYLLREVERAMSWAA
jgi:hypothetical protein